MLRMSVLAAAAIAAFAVSAPTSSARAQEGTVAFKSLNPDVAFALARAALEDCRKRGYQVAVAVVDRFGQTQVMLRDRFAGPHTPATASGKGWTAVSFRTNTSELVVLTKEGSPQAGVRNLPGVVVLGGGLMIESGGSIVGGVGVSGAPGGEADDACARAGIEAVRDKLDF
ncbi:MAG: heme-binding protein [Pseudorhodoplanes sp.]|nr:heme-binding protein [Pseudorhodoplanes sp.]MCL4710687.1 heme-binding protein [Pseudorhodoplanes sp.]MCQ3941893.1 heme-binding protein [Alphaproteobacteria bacterium]MCZ7642327.1 heme-binding protein [Pseudorhodoplanes sp.]